MTEKLLEYFSGDELAADVWMSKYQIKDNSGNPKEETPDDMHWRLAKEFARVDYKNIQEELKTLNDKDLFIDESPLSDFGKRLQKKNNIFSLQEIEEDIYNYFKDFKYIIPQGSIMSILGNHYKTGSLSNCLSGITKVLTRGGYKPISTLVNRTETILTKGGGWVEAEFRSFDTQSLMKLELSRGKSDKKIIECTPNHRWFLSNDSGKIKEVITSELKPGDKLHNTISKGSGSYGLSPFGIAHGIVFGDGHTVKGINNSNNIILCADSRILGKYFINQKISSDETLCEGGSDHYGNIPNYFRKFPNLFENKAYLYGWLAGYFAADGNIDENGSLAIHSVDKHNIEFVQSVCGILGIFCGDIKSQTVISNLTNKEHTMYKVFLHANHLSENFFLLEKHKSRYNPTDKAPSKWTVVSVTYTGEEKEVFCAVVPETHSFVIEGNILTGNCFVVPSPYDSYGGICKTDEEMAQLMKRRGGVGTNLNTLRPAKTIVNNAAGTSTGSASFMERYSNTTREVAQDGRRGALMLLMDVRHPDIFKFVTSKKDRTKVTGANISVMLTDDFLLAAKEGGYFLCKFPIDCTIDYDDGGFQEWWAQGKLNELWEYNKNIHLMRIDAKELFDLIIEMAWENAEPGLAFIDAVNNYSPDGVYHIINKSNPCVVKGTLVNTPLGYFKVEDLKIGDCVSTIIGSEPIKTIEVNENCKLIEIIFSDGGKQIVTPNHIYYGKLAKTDSKKMLELKAKDLNIGDYIRVFPNIIQTKDFHDYKKFLKKGILLGDGSYTLNCIKKSQVSISCNSDEENYISNLEKLFSIKRKRDYDSNSKAVKIYLPKEENEKIDLKDYNDSSEKNIDILSIQTIDAAIGLLDGILATDGNINLKSNHPQIRWDTCSYNLSQTIRQTLLLIGCHGFISESFSKGGKINGREIIRRNTKYTVSISGNSILQYYKISKILEIHPEKGTKLLSAVKDFNLSGNLLMSTVKNIKYLEETGTTYDLFCEKSDTWITEGYVQRGCGEQWLPDYDSCRLMALNLFSIVNNPFESNATINYEKLYEIAYMQQRLADNLVDLEIEHVEAIIQKIKNDSEPEEIKATELLLWQNVLKVAIEGRRTGCGFTGLGDMIAALGFKYDSKESLEIINKVCYIKMQAELDCTIDLSILRGSFIGWNPKLEYPININGDDFSHGNKFYEMLWYEFPDQIERMQNYGRRNISFSTVAPTGSLSVIAKAILNPNLSAGMEPQFGVYFMRRRKINPSDTSMRTDFVDQNGDHWQEYPVLMGAFKDWLIIQGKYYKTGMDNTYLKDCFEQSPWYGSTANDINWEKRVEIQSIIQKYTTNAISSTINLPSTVTKEQVANIYWKAWELGLKGVTVYRDGCRTGVLINPDTNTKEVAFSQKDAVKRPKVLNCDVHSVKVKGIDYTVVVSILDNHPYEVFIAPNVVTTCKKGTVIREKKGKYHLLDEGSELCIDNLSTRVNEEEASIARLLSTSLRHGTAVEHLVNQLNKTHGALVSYSKAISRVLSKYVETKETGEKCPECGEKLSKEEGCTKCYTCGFSKC